MTVSQSVITMDPPKPTKDDLEDKPWKYYGYKAFSEWAASDDDFFVLRRFKNLNTRVLLRMQDHIVQLERDLRKLDKEHSRVEAVDVNNGTFRYDTVDGRKQILGRVQEKLKEYSQFFTFASIPTHLR